MATIPVRCAGMHEIKISSSPDSMTAAKRLPSAV